MTVRAIVLMCRRCAVKHRVTDAASLSVVPLRHRCRGGNLRPFTVTYDETSR